MDRRIILYIFIAVAFADLLTSAPLRTNDSIGVPSLNSPVPAYQMAAHDRNKLNLAITNHGTFGIGYAQASHVDVFDGANINFSCEYPRSSSCEYLFGSALWIGGKVNGQPHVSIAHDGWYGIGDEFSPDTWPFGNMLHRSRLDSNSVLFEHAISEQDFVAEYYDTLHSNATHWPLGLKVTQVSLEWQDTLVEDFIIVEFHIRNIGNSVIDSTYIGLLVDGDVGTYIGNSFLDDFAGFSQANLVEGYDNMYDTVSFAWLADGDGDPNGSVFNEESCPNVTGVTLLRMPTSDSKLSFNWWNGYTPCTNFIGPYHMSDTNAWIRAGTTPYDDSHFYHLLSNGEIDPDPIHFRLLPNSDTIWADYPSSCQYYTFMDPRYLLSAGPFTLAPNDSVIFTIAFVGGKNFHPVARQISNPPANLLSYVNGLNFTDIASNALRARQKYRRQLDPDEDNIATRFDNCPFLSNPEQTDIDHNGVGDVCQCEGIRGDVNGDGKANPTIQDLIYLSRCLFEFSSSVYHFPLEADVNGDGKHTVADLSMLVAFLFGNNHAIPDCPTVYVSAIEE